LLKLSWVQLQSQGDPLVQLALILENIRQGLAKDIYTQFNNPLQALNLPKPKLAYAEADQTPRISYGKIRKDAMADAMKDTMKNSTTGHTTDDLAGSAFTFIADIYSKKLSPLPQIWTDAKDKVKLNTQLNFVSTADSVGGSSGSAVIDEKGDLVGLVFDATAEARDTELFYDEKTNRTIALSASAVREILKNIYRLNYLEPQKKPAKDN
jgi:hypothetical protein